MAQNAVFSDVASTIARTVGIDAEEVAPEKSFAELVFRDSHYLIMNGTGHTISGWT
jgi:acyl carrier protein